MPTDATTGRAEEEPDPTRIATRQDFARELTLVRLKAGRTVREVARMVGIRDSTAGGYFSGRHLPALRPNLLLENILRACGVTDPAEIAEWGRALSRVRRAPGPRPAGEPAPYRGLETFRREDAEWFYGREALTEEVVRLVHGRGPDDLPLMVVGASGSGKSSLLRAGVIPVLEAGPAAPGAPGWRCELFVPGAHPLRRLALRLGSLTGADGEDLLARLADDPGSVVEAIVGAGDRLLLVVDQFEEVFTQCPDQNERRVFITALCAAAGPATVVIGLRADFYPQAARYPALVPALQHAQVVVGPMTEPELRRAIVQPARRAAIDLDAGLVELILRDLAPYGTEAAGAAHEAGTLPLLSHALLATWRRGQRQRLTVSDYQLTGGIAGAIAQTAEEVYQGLYADERDTARQLFLRLVHVDADTADTRRRVPHSEILQDRTDVETADLVGVLDQFIEQRLVTADANTVEIAHEALLSAWPRLRSWLDTDRAGLRTHRQLTDAAHAWEDSGRDPQLLYHGGRLAVASEWVSDPGHEAGLNALERGFLAESVRAGEQQRLAERRRTLRLRGLLAAVTVLLLLSGALAGYLVDQRARATRQRDLAISRQVATDANGLRGRDPNLAMQLALAAYRIAPTAEARSSLLDSSGTTMATRILGPPGVMQALAVTSDGHTLAAGGTDGTVRLWDISEPLRPVPQGAPLRASTGTNPTVFSVAFRPGGRLLAAGGTGGTVRLWDVPEPGRPAAQLAALTGATGHIPTVFSVVFSPDGRTLAAGGADGALRLWDLSDPARPVPIAAPLTGHTGYIQAIAFSTDGRTVATGSADRTVRLWDLGDRRHPGPLGRPLGGPAKAVLAVTFSPDGRTLAAGSADKTVYRWSLARRPDPSPLPPLGGFNSWVNAVAYSPDGLALAAGSSDNTVRIWGRGDRLAARLPHPGPVTALAYLRDDHTLASSAADGVARLWHLPGPVITLPADSVFSVQFTPDGRQLAVAAGTADNTVSVWDVADPDRPVLVGPSVGGPPAAAFTGAMAVSPDGRTVAAGSVDGTVRLWRLRDPPRSVPVRPALTGPTSVVQSLAFSPDGRRLAVSTNDYTVWLWDLTDPGRPRVLTVLRGPTNYAYGVAFSPDGRLLAVGSADDTVWMWDITEPGRPRTLATLRGPTSYVFSVAFSPNGRILAAGSADKTTWLWDVTDPGRPRLLRPPLSGPTNYVYGVTFDAAGEVLAAASGDKTVWLWRVADPARPAVLATLSGPGDSVVSLAFAPDGATLAAGTADNTARLWKTDPAAVADDICATAGDRITQAEWARYITGLPYDPPC